MSRAEDHTIVFSEPDLIEVSMSRHQNQSAAFRHTDLFEVKLLKFVRMLKVHCGADAPGGLDGLASHFPFAADERTAILINNRAPMITVNGRVLQLCNTIDKVLAVAKLLCFEEFAVEKGSVPAMRP